MKLISCFLMITFFLASHFVRANPVITDKAIPKNIHVYSTAGSTYVDHLSGYCGSSRFVLSPNHVKYDAIVAILLAAQLSNKEVQLRFDGCVNNDNQGNIIGVYLP